MIRHRHRLTRHTEFSNMNKIGVGSRRRRGMPFLHMTAAIASLLLVLGAPTLNASSRAIRPHDLSRRFYIFAPYGPTAPFSNGESNAPLAYASLRIPAAPYEPPG